MGTVMALPRGQGKSGPVAEVHQMKENPAQPHISVMVAPVHNWSIQWSVEMLFYDTLYNNAERELRRTEQVA